MIRLLPPAVAVVVIMSTAASAADTKLIDAVKRQDAAAVERMLKAGADANTSLADGATALHWAVYLDDRKLVDPLIRAKANVNVANELGVTPLMLACENRSAAMVDRLLRAGANPNAATPSGETAVMTAARAGDAQVMKLLLAHGGDAKAKETVQDQTALMWAASERHSDVVRLLLDAGADVRARTKVPPPRRRGGVRPSPGAGAGASPAGQAGAGGGRAGDAGAGGAAEPAAGDDAAAVAAFFGGNRGNGFTALLFASRVGDVESARLLLDAGADVNDTAADGMGALVLATVRANVPLAMELLERGANPNADATGYTALHWAAGTWESELTVRAITTEREGEWSTVAGLKAGKLELVKALVAHGANPNARIRRAPARAGSSKNPAIPELEGATPLILAAMAGDVAVMRALLAAGSDPRLVTTRNGNILMAAAGLGHVQGEDFVKEANALAAARTALDLGVDPNATDTSGNTAMHYAAYMRHDSVVQLLVDRGASIEVKNKYGETPLWTAELVVQFMGGGTYQLLPSPASELLRKLGAKSIEPSYTRARPTDWPDNPRVTGDEVEAPRNPKDATAAPDTRRR